MTLPTRAVRACLLGTTFAAATLSAPGWPTRPEARRPGDAEPLRAMGLRPRAVDRAFVPDGDGLALVERPEAMPVRIGADGAVSFRADTAPLRMRLVGVGRGRVHAEPAALGTTSGLAVLDRGAVREWYVGAAGGLEQGFDVLARPEGEGPLSVAVSVDDALTRGRGDGGLDLVDGSGAVVASLTRLAAVDASGRSLPAHMRATADGYRMDVDDAGAAYPVRIDPFVSTQTATLSMPLAGLDPTAHCGAAVEMVNGTVVVGCPDADVEGVVDAGVVLVFQPNATGGYTLAHTLSAGVRAPGAHFGHALDFDGKTIVVGAPGELAPGNSTLLAVGAVYVFDSTIDPNFGSGVRFVAPDPSGYLQLGASVALDDTVVYAGAPGGSPSTAGQLTPGSVYAFSTTDSTNPFLFEFGGPSPSGEDGFGHAIAAHGGVVVVGAPMYDTAPIVGLNAGAAYVFDVDLGGSGGAATLRTELTPEAAAAGMNFGTSVDYDGAHAVVGAPRFDSLRGATAGGVGVYDAGNGFVREAWLTANDGAAGDFFGTSVSVAGDSILVGAPTVSLLNLSTRQGAAYLYVSDGTAFVPGSKIRPSDAVTGDSMGFDVALDPTRPSLVLGAPTDSVNNSSATGTARVYGVPELAFVHVSSDRGDGTGTVGAVPDGIACGADCVEVYAVGTTVTLTATAASGNYLDRVDGDCTASPCSVVLTADGLTADFVFQPKKPNGEACGRPLECSSGQCVDGVCCNSACGNGASDCQACSTEAGGTTDGSCTPLSVDVASSVVCRQPAGDCDRGETCSANSVECPLDRLLDTTQVCRPARNATCDVAEVCTGTSASCPADVASPADTLCDNGITCDGIDRCDGAGSCVRPGPMVCPDDGNPCTIDLCVENLGCYSAWQPTCTLVDGGAVFTDAGTTPSDAGADGSTADSGPYVPPPPSFQGEGGCACAVDPGRPSERGPLGLALTLLGLGLARRRRR